MAQSGTLDLINGTAGAWTRTAVASSHLTSWSDAFPATLAAGAQQLVSIALDDSSSGPWSGSVTYSVGSDSFEIQLSGTASTVTLQVVWNSTPNSFVVFPPANADGSASAIGWNSGGTVPMGVFNSGSLSTVAADSPWTANWMAIYAGCFGTATLCSLQIPGTHDSGTYKMLGGPIVDHWARCQDLDFTGQLNAGARYFDMRVGYVPYVTGDLQFIMVHEMFPSETTLAAALQQIVQFLNAHPFEIVILDFHRFTDFSQFPPQFDDAGFPYAQLAEVVSTALGNLQFDLAGTSPCNVTVANVYAGNGRALVSFNVDSSVYSNAAFLPPIDQKWQGSSDEENTRAGLEAFIKTVMADPPTNQIWAQMAGISSFWNPPQSLAPDIDNWFYGGSQWAQTVNVVATDYIEQTVLVSNLVCTAVFVATR